MSTMTTMSEMIYELATRSPSPTALPPLDVVPLSDPSTSTIPPLPREPKPGSPSALHSTEDKLPTKTSQVTLHPHGLLPVTTTLRPEWANLFFRFCGERHRIWERRLAGLPREEWTEDETMQKTFVGNVFRELDAGSIRVREEVVGKGDQSHLEICFRQFLHCAFYKDTTWQALCEASSTGIPTWSTWQQDLPAYEAALYRLSMVEKRKIYTGGFQIVPPTIYFGRNLPHFAASLRFVQALMEMGMPNRLFGLRYAVDASSILQTAPTLGGFLSLNLLCYLNSTPHLRYQYRNFASCGPGARMFLQRIFGRETINSVAMEEAGLRWLYEHQWAYWAAMKMDPPHAWTIGLRPGMRVLDFENALCWCHRYVNDYSSKGYRSQADKPALEVDIPGLATAAAGSGTTWDPPSWVPEERYAETANKAAWAGDYDEESQKVPELKEEGEGVYEVEKIVARKGDRNARDGLFRVRWKGWPPEDDTWERGSSLEGSQEALDEWLDWERGVWDTLARITRDMPYVAPRGVKVEPSTPVVQRTPRTPRKAPTPRSTHTAAATRRESMSVASSRSGSASTEESTPLQTPRTPQSARALRSNDSGSISSATKAPKGSHSATKKTASQRTKRTPRTITRNGTKFASDEEAEAEVELEISRKRPRRVPVISYGEHDELKEEDM